MFLEGSSDIRSTGMKPVEVARPNRFFAEQDLFDLLGQYEALREGT